MATKKKTTHVGIEIGRDGRTPDGFKRKVKIRETKLYWICEHGNKYLKKYNGIGTGDYPLFQLDLESIKPINQ